VISRSSRIIGIASEVGCPLFRLLGFQIGCTDTLLSDARITSLEKVVKSAALRPIGATEAFEDLFSLRQNRCERHPRDEASLRQIIMRDRLVRNRIARLTGIRTGNAQPRPDFTLIQENLRSQRTRFGMPTQRNNAGAPSSHCTCLRRKGGKSAIQRNRIAKSFRRHVIRSGGSRHYFCTGSYAKGCRCGSKPSLKQSRCVSKRAQMHRTQGQAAFAECASRCRANVAVMDGSVFGPARHGSQIKR
jgi:hypothetical protein